MSQVLAEDGSRLPHCQPNRRIKAWLATTVIIASSALAVRLSPAAWTKIAPTYASVLGYALYVEGPQPQVAAIGEIIELKAKLTAVGSHDVEVVGASLPCGCLELSPMPLRIPRGETQEMVIWFDTSGRSPMEFTVNINLFLSVPSPQVSIPMCVSIVDPNFNDND